MDLGRAGSRAAVYGMLMGLAMVFSYVEAILPVPMPVPGAKLGLANLVTVVGLYTVGPTGTAAVTLARVLLVGFTFGNAFGMVYGLAGGALSLILMIPARRFTGLSPVGVSVIGGVGHNIGQLAVAAFVARTAGVFLYLPALLAAGTVAGALIGLLGGLVTERIRAGIDPQTQTRPRAGGNPQTQTRPRAGGNPQAQTRTRDRQAGPEKQDNRTEGGRGHD